MDDADRIARELYATRRREQRRQGVTRIYAIACEHFHKIGLADDVEKRIEVMKLLNPFPVSCVFYRTIPRRRAYFIERSVHAVLRDKHRRCYTCRTSITSAKHHSREWFAVSLQEIRDAVALAIQEARRVDRDEARRETINRRAAATLERAIGTPVTQATAAVSLSP